MNMADPQFLYMTLILPGLFGLTLVGEGIYKITQDHTVGWFNIVMGVGFIIVVGVAFIALSGNFFSF